MSNPKTEKDYKERMEFWRRTAMRVIASYLNELLDTSFDIQDRSPRLKDETLSDDTVEIRVPIKNRVSDSMIHVACSELASSFETEYTDIAYEGEWIIFTFTRYKEEE